MTQPSRRPHPRRAALAAALLGAVALLALWATTLGSESASARTIHFAGETARAPSSWPVYRLDRHPRMCVRLDRRAVYLGMPSASQRCPAEAIGRRRAIVVEPRSAPARDSTLPSAPRRRATGSAGGTVFTGLGFDACSAPSSREMAGWAASPYRAVGVYVGGINRACSQPNLTSSWVAAQTGFGWHLIPTYVGLQAPTSSCSSCAKLNAVSATTQGTAAAIDAVEEATAISIGPGSPIYFDMESYSRTSSASRATLAFLEAWTNKLHALGYLSGVYSSSASGIADLSTQYGTGYESPDAIWTANWNGSQSTADPVLPATVWAQHQRIHQYRGGHDESYGTVRINIDNNYLDGPTVGSAALGGEDDPIGYIDFADAPRPGQVRVRGWAFDPSSPTAPLGIRLTVGGREGDADALPYELGPAIRGRGGVATEFPEAGSRHGFDATLPVVKSGKQRVCAYAIGIAPGADSELGCRAARIPVPIKLSKIKVERRRVRLRVTCQWPEGTECPGQVVLRARFRVRVRPYPGRGPHTRPVSRVLGRRAFHLTGHRGHTFQVPISAEGRTVLRRRGRLRTQIVVAIPGGKRIHLVAVGR